MRAQRLLPTGIAGSAADVGWLASDLLAHSVVVRAGDLAAGVSLATAIPAGPGYLGTFELAAVQIAAVFGVGADPAVALAVLVHAVILVLTSVGGAVALLLLGWRRKAGVAAMAPSAR